jgi:hypothetical protein
MTAWNCSVQFVGMGITTEWERERETVPSPEKTPTTGCGSTRCCLHPVGMAWVRSPRLLKHRAAGKHEQSTRCGTPTRRAWPSPRSAIGWCVRASHTPSRSPPPARRWPASALFVARSVNRIVLCLRCFCIKIRGVKPPMLPGYDDTNMDTAIPR